MVIPCVVLIAILLYMKISVIFKATKNTRFVGLNIVFGYAKCTLGNSESDTIKYHDILQ